MTSPRLAKLASLGIGLIAVSFTHSHSALTEILMPSRCSRSPVLASDQFTVKVTLVELVSDPDVPVSVSVLEPVGVPPVGV